MKDGRTDETQADGDINK